MSLKTGLNKRTPLRCWLAVIALAIVVLPGAIAKPTHDESEPKQATEDSTSTNEPKGRITLRWFEGNAFWTSESLRIKLVGEKSYWNLLSEVFSPDTIPADTKALTDEYRNAGFFDVKVTGKALYSRDRSDVRLAFTITEGLRYKIREIRFEGNKRIATADFEEQLTLKPGDKWNSVAVAADTEKIRSRYAGLTPTASVNPVPYFLEQPGEVDLVFEIHEELTARIRLADDFIPSWEMDLKGNSVVAFVDEMPITADEIIGESVITRMNQDKNLSIEQQRVSLMQFLTRRLPDFLYDEVVFNHFADNVADVKRAAIVESVARSFAEVLEKIRIDNGAVDTEELEKCLLLQGRSIGQLRKSFNRRQIVVGYIESLPAESPLRDKNAIERHCRQLLFEARLRKRVTLSFDNAPFTEVLQSLESEHHVSICRKAMFLFDTPAVVTAHIQDQPLLDAIKAIIDPNLLQVSVGREEIVIASTPNQKNGPTSQTSRIIGAVRMPGIYVFDADKDWTILDALRLAGGLSDDAGKTITVTRKNDAGDAALIECDLVEVAEGLDSNILLAPGDVVVVEFAEDDAVAVKPDATEAARLFLCTYPVADLIVTGPDRLLARGIKENDLQTELNRDPSNAGILRQDGISAQALPRMGDPKFAEVTKMDFAPIVEFIKASVEPESWGDKGTIAVDIETKSLVIRQTGKAHEEIADLITQLRNGQDANVHFTSLLVKLTNEEQLNVIKEHSTLQSSAEGMKWALLTPKRSETLTKALLDQKPEIISSPRIMTTSGQAATIMVGSIDKSVFNGLKLTVKPQLVPDSSIIRLQHTFSIVPDREPDKSESDTYVNARGVTISGPGHEIGDIPHESLVGSGQTLLLLIEQPYPDDAAKSVDRYVLMLTPEHVVEAVEKVDGGEAETDPASSKASAFQAKP